MGPRAAAALTEMVLALDAENEKLRVAMQTFKDMIFGKRSERLAALVAEQLALELDDLETGITPPTAANDDAAAAKPHGKPPRKKARRNIGALPKHLPRCEQVLEPEATACPCCQGRLHKIGEDVSEVLDVIPAMLRVLRTVRPKYGCRRCTDGVIQAKVLPRLIESGLASTALVSHTWWSRSSPGICRCTGRCRSWPAMASSLTGDTRRLDQACRLVAQEPLRAPAADDLGCPARVLRRDADAGARSRTTSSAHLPVLGACHG
ncbi:IS66 family transposase zinc-finger binding domain-containing protein [Bradyrhizobium sp. CCGUVB1N3]|nr:IS66 family transposase zinc-finger binding domain-containing protein [Bradyrhizobium sp. CCGUVB1N3]MCP3475504.1 IS66 family transposase zinc-finger binding domain-containing protein [Bradyrhizobium sp. CCGUVB1N3]